MKAYIRTDSKGRLNPDYIVKSKQKPVIPYEILELEKEQMLTSIDIYGVDEMDLNNVYWHFYHGIRFQKYLEKLENIFRCKKLLAGKYLDCYYYNYGDNCNMGEYVSLLSGDYYDTLEFQRFIRENVSLVISPLCNAYETKYVDFNVWEKVKKYKLKLKNLYSYMHGEYFCKDNIPLEMVRAVGVSYHDLQLNGDGDYADQLLEDITVLMDKYNVKLPIVDTSRYNKVLVDVNGSDKKKVKLK